MGKQINLKLIRSVTIVLSVIILFGSGFLFIQASPETLTNPLFGVLVFLLIVDTICFVFFKVKTNSQKISQKQAKKHAELLELVSSEQIVKGQKPHA